MRKRVLIVIAGALTAAGGYVWAEEQGPSVKQEASEQSADAGSRIRDAAEGVKQRVEEGVRALRADARSAGEELRDSSAGRALRADLKQLGASTRQTFADTAITVRIETALLLAKDVTSSGISVHTHDGHVSLDGQLPDQAQAQRAVDIARRTQGVTGVDNRLSAG